jgi:hypothetical protein
MDARLRGRQRRASQATSGFSRHIAESAAGRPVVRAVSAYFDRRDPRKIRNALLDAQGAFVRTVVFSKRGFQRSEQFLPLG